MADLTPHAAAPSAGLGSERPSPTDARAGGHWPARLAMGLLLLAPLLGVVVFRLVAFGWGVVAPDDARYLNVGLAVLDGRGPLTPDGNVFLLRSPTYGVALALGARVVGGDPLVGARLVGASLMCVGLVAAIRLGWVVRGFVGGGGTLVAILATPLIWRLLPTLRIDLVQAAAAMGLILALRHPSSVRWAIAGGLFGLSILVKETGMLLGLLPLAWLGLLPTRRWLRLAAVFTGVGVVVAGWWWLFVWLKAGVLFPLNAIGTIERRDVAGALHVGRSSIPFVVTFALSWLIVARAVRRDVDVRLLIGAVLALLPPAIYATVNGLSTRNYAALALLSCVAAGVAGANVLAALSQWLIAHRPRSRGRWLAIPLAFVLVATPAVALGQHQVGRPGQATLPDILSAWLLERAGPGERVVMTFRLREVVGLEIGDRVPVASLSAKRVRAGDDPAGYVWMGLRDRQLFGYSRSTWLSTLAEPTSRFFVSVEPHAFTPLELLAFLGSPSGRAVGFTPVADLREGTDVAHVFALDPDRVGAGGTTLRLHLSPDAVKAWAALGGGATTDALARLASARPIVVGGAVQLQGLLSALGPGVCLAPAGPDEPPGSAVLGAC